MSGQEARGARGGVPTTHAALAAAAVAARDALLAERAALEAGDATALTRLADEKRRRVMALENALRSGAPTLPGDVVAVLRECRELNARNATSVAARLGQTRAALERLSRLVGAGESAGYGADGTIARAVSRRTLGTG